MNKLKVISSDYETRRKAELKENTEKIIKNMLKMNMKIKDIEKIMELTKEEILKYKN